MAADWTHVRLRTSTHARLLAELNRQLRLYNQGARSILECPDGGRSVDSLIVALLDRLADHRARGSKRKRRLTSGPAVSQAVPDVTSG